MSVVLFSFLTQPWKHCPAGEPLLDSHSNGQDKADQTLQLQYMDFKWKVSRVYQCCCQRPLQPSVTDNGTSQLRGVTGARVLGSIELT